MRATRMVLGYPLTVELLPAGADWQVCITGGCAPHIGSVTVAGANGQILQKWMGAGHRDDVVGDRFAAALAARAHATVCVSSGIHYDNATSAQLEQIVAACDELLEQALAALS